MLKVTVPVAKPTQARAYMSRIRAEVLNMSAVARGDEFASAVNHNNGDCEVVVGCKSPERLVQIVQTLYKEDYI